MNDFFAMKNGGHLPVREIPLCDMPEFRTKLISAVKEKNWRISAFFQLPDKRLCIICIGDGALQLLSAPECRSYPALTTELPAMQNFERELFENTGIRPEGHPWLKPVRFIASASGKRPLPAETEYFTLQGDSAHEVAVGPVHAGVIEPGHFRFQCMGEDVYSLEISLGYQHRGIEKMLTGGPDARTPHLIETAAGDTSCAAAVNYSRIVETLSGTPATSRGERLRLLALELERIANHTGDLGALAGDVAFLPTSSFCGRIRGDFLNMTAALCGNRFGRGMIVPGGFRYDLDDTARIDLLKRVETGEKELFHAVNLMFDEPSVLDRFENTGSVPAELAREIGLVGVAGRASGLKIDSRADFGGKEKICTGRDGDVLSRAWVRKLELEESLRTVKEILASPLPQGPCKAPVNVSLAPDTLAVSVTEAWRGELCHAAVTDEKGKFSVYKIVDPSFHNWFGLAMALRDQQISDFPICNKSFNLSYCGHDL